MTNDTFKTWLSRWQLVPDGAVIHTPHSHLLPVLRGGVPAFLKIADSEDERRGAELLEWFEARGAVRVFEREGEAVLLERLGSAGALANMACAGDDDAATKIICRTIAELHAPRPTCRPASLVDLSVWFHQLRTIANELGGILVHSLDAAEMLLASPREIIPLHGDIHHGNVLESYDRGWVAIDPKGLIGERGYDYANLFCNPTFAMATEPGRLRRQAEIVAECANLELPRLLSWILAYAGLSAAWLVEEGKKCELAWSVAEIAALELGTETA